MYLKPFKNFTYSVVSEQDKLSALKKTNMKILEGRFRNLIFSTSTKKTTEYSFELFLCIYRYFKFKTSVLSNNRFRKQAIKAFKNISFSKATVFMRFPAKKNAGCPKAQRDFLPRKNGKLHPPLGCLGTPLSLPQSLYGRAGHVR